MFPARPAPTCARCPTANAPGRSFRSTRIHRCRLGERFIAPHSSLLVLLLIMLHERVAEVVVEIAVDAVNVVRLILGVVVLDQERRALNEIVVWLAGFEAAGP